jgi:hypothetical protein
MPEFRAFHVARRWTGGGMAKAVAHGREFADGPIEFVRFRQQPLAPDPRFAIRREHCSNLIQREPGGTAERDERQLLQDTRLEQPPQAAPTDRSDEAFLLVESKRGCGSPGAPRNFDNIHARTLDLKFA